MIHRVFFVAGLAALVLAGCVIHVDTREDDDWLDIQRDNERAIQRLRMGRGIDSVRAEMGSPDFVDVFTRGGDEFTVLFYRTHHERADGRTTRDETTPLVFVNGELVGWGESAIDNATAR